MKPVVHSQRKLPCEFIQVPCWQGLLMHSSMSVTEIQDILCLQPPQNILSYTIKARLIVALLIKLKSIVNATLNISHLVCLNL
jgi:hypothetical protein